MVKDVSSFPNKIIFVSFEIFKKDTSLGTHPASIAAGSLGILACTSPEHALGVGELPAKGSGRQTDRRTDGSSSRTCQISYQLDWGGRAEVSGMLSISLCKHSSVRLRASHSLPLDSPVTPSWRACRLQWGTSSPARETSTDNPQSRLPTLQQWTDGWIYGPFPITALVCKTSKSDSENWNSSVCVMIHQWNSPLIAGKQTWGQIKLPISSQVPRYL